MEYTTVAAAKAYGEFVGDESDDLLSALIGSASMMINRYCRRSFTAQDETVRVFRKSRVYDDSFNGQVLIFDEDLAEDASLIQDPDDLTWDPDVFYLQENKPPFWAVELEEGSWPDVVEVTGYWCYSRTPPTDVEYACLRLVKWLYDLRDTTKGQIPIITPEGEVLMPEGLPSDIRAILSPYIRMQLA